MFFLSTSFRISLASTRRKPKGSVKEKHDFSRKIAGNRLFVDLAPGPGRAHQKVLNGARNKFCWKIPKKKGSPAQKKHMRQNRHAYFRRRPLYSRAVVQDDTRPLRFLSKARYEKRRCTGTGNLPTDPRLCFCKRVLISLVLPCARGMLHLLRV